MRLLRLEGPTTTCQMLLAESSGVPVETYRRMMAANIRDRLRECAALDDDALLALCTFTNEEAP